MSIDFATTGNVPDDGCDEHRMPIDRLAISKSTTHKEEFKEHVHADRGDQHTTNHAMQRQASAYNACSRIASLLGYGR
eukprot:12469452-Alexandrium_andersonii.AAC.1